MKKEQGLVMLAFLAIYFIWGSTYLANWYAIQDIPPFIMGGSRFLLAGIIMLIYGFFSRAAVPDRQAVKGAATNGFLFLAIGTGGVVWAQQFVASNIAALLVAFQPLLIVLMLWRFEKQHLTWNSAIGILLGVMGMILLVGQPRFGNDPQTYIGIAAIFLSISAWAYAATKGTRLSQPISPVYKAAIQMLSGGVSLLFLGVLLGEPWQFNITDITLRSGLAFMYLVVFGSIIAFSAFIFLLGKVSADKVSTSNYINPVVAMILGWGLNGEVVTSMSVWAAALLLLGVLFMNVNLRVFVLRQRASSQLVMSRKQISQRSARIRRMPRPTRIRDYVVSRTRQ